jgi:hypothetical protein
MRLRILALIAALALVALVAATITIWTLSSPPTATTPAPSETAPPPPASSTRSYDPDAGDVASGENDGAPAEVQEAAWGPVADRFARNFTNTTGGAPAWRQRLIGNPASPDVTTDISDQLKTIAVSNVPAGHYTGRQLVKSSAYEVAVKVTYREGWAMIVYLITDGTGYQICAYDRWEA